MKEKLSAKENLFCQFYSQTQNGREAAYKAGYFYLPERTSLKLLAKPLVKNKIAALSQKKVCQRDVAAGLRRLAFGNVSDGIKLMLDDKISDIEALDLFNISEIKRPKTGGMEIKFFDRIKAFEKLMAMTQLDDEETSMPFYKALEKSARNVEKLVGDQKDD